MKVTLELDDDLMWSAAELMNIEDVSALVHHAIRELIQRESARKLAALGGSMPTMNQISRRRESDSFHI